MIGRKMGGGCIFWYFSRKLTGQPMFEYALICWFKIVLLITYWKFIAAVQGKYV